MKNIFILLNILLCVKLISFEITDEQAVQIGLQFVPQRIVDLCTEFDEDCNYTDLDKQIYYLKDARKYGWEPNGNERVIYPWIFEYFSFKMPNDENDYLFLSWDDRPSGYHYWRILKTLDNGRSFFSVCESKDVGSGCFGWSYRLIDLTGDDIPELLKEDALCGGGGNTRFFQAIMIWQWKNGCFENIVKYGNEEDENDRENYISSNSHLEIDDLDGDGKAEIIAGPLVLMDTSYDEEGNEDVQFIPQDNIEVWHYNGENFVIWYELDPSEEYPLYVPSLAAFHPSTIPLSELKNPGKGKIKIFISDPAGVLTSNDFQTDSFKYLETSIEFKKIWKNQKYPSEDKANFEFVGVPVYQSLRKSQGDWQTNPSDPYILSPDLKMEYHFVGDYIEIEMPRSLVFAHLQKKAEEEFEKLPDKDTVFISLSFEGKFKNGKKGVISAIIAVKKTGNEKK